MLKKNRPPSKHPRSRAHTRASEEIAIIAARISAESRTNQRKQATSLTESEKTQRLAIGKHLIS